MLSTAVMADQATGAVFAADPRLMKPSWPVVLFLQLPFVFALHFWVSFMSGRVRFASRNQLIPGPWLFSHCWAPLTMSPGSLLERSRIDPFVMRLI